MTETGKTVTFVGVALALGIVAFVARPRHEVVRAPDIVGKTLFEKFTDASKAANMKVVRYAEDVGEVHTFEVAKRKGSDLWTIPSHGHYPADATDQMKDAATCLVGVTVLDVASEDKGDHQMFGVIEPNKDELKVGDKGVGLLVSFLDEKGESLGKLVIGKEVKGNKEQRFVRIPGQDPVYVAKINTEKLSTKFEDWIEKDLLKISTWDVEGLELKDYSVLPTVNGYAIQPRSEAKVTFNTAESKWNLEKMIVYKGTQPQPGGLLEGEELNKEKLDELKNTLNSVKIVDVFAKPEGLGANLKASGDFVKDPESRRSLEQRGFIVHPETNDLLSANGELRVFMKEGVEYVLRFGNVAGEEEGSKEGKLNRYLFVTARVDESKFPPPKLEDLPGAAAGDPVPSAPGNATPEPAPENPATEKPATDKPATAEPAGEKPSEDPPSDGPARPDRANGCGEAQEPDSEKKSETTTDSAETAKPETAKPETVKPETAKPETAKPETAKPETAKVDGSKGQDKSADAKPPAKPAADAPPAAESEEEIKAKKLAADRERVTKENQRKLDEWRSNKQKAEEKVNELNARFADWYYVISEDVYKKLHLSRGDIVKEGEKAAEEGTGVDAFRKLETDGLKKTPDVPKG